MTVVQTFSKKIEPITGTKYDCHQDTKSTKKNMLEHFDFLGVLGALVATALVFMSFLELSFLFIELKNNDGIKRNDFY